MNKIQALRIVEQLVRKAFPNSLRIRKIDESKFIVEIKEEVEIEYALPARSSGSNS